MASPQLEHCSWPPPTARAVGKGTPPLYSLLGGQLNKGEALHPLTLQFGLAYRKKKELSSLSLTRIGGYLLFLPIPGAPCKKENPTRLALLWLYLAMLAHL